MLISSTTVIAGCNLLVNFEQPSIIKKYKKYFNNRLFKEFQSTEDIKNSLLEIANNFVIEIKKHDIDIKAPQIHVEEYEISMFMFHPFYGEIILIPDWFNPKVQENIKFQMQVTGLTLQESWTLNHLLTYWAVMGHELGHQLQHRTGALKNMSPAEKEKSANEIMIAFWKTQPDGIKKLKIVIKFLKELRNKLPIIDYEGLSKEDYIEQNYAYFMTPEGLATYAGLQFDWKIEIFETQFKTLNLKDLIDQLKRI